jgi:hypothetical protein
MKTASKFTARSTAHLLRALLLMQAGAGTTALPSEGALGEEMAVIQTMAMIVNRDATYSYDFLYFESDFSTGAHVASSISNPDRTQFCGLTREQAQSVVNELATISSDPVKFDNSTAKPAGLKVGHKKLPRFRYLFLSRVVFDPNREHAWVAVDQNGETGALMRLDKIDGQWSKTARCGGWIKT